MRYPLRRIVSEENDQYGRVVEVLECGHKVTQKEDIYGPTNAYKRRCRHCEPILTPIEQAHQSARRGYMEKARKG